MPDTLSKHEVKRCPRCGRRFECKANNPVHCACADLELPQELMEEIETVIDDCLCTVCLMEIRKGGEIEDTS